MYNSANITLLANRRCKRDKESRFLPRHRLPQHSTTEISLRSRKYPHPPSPHPHTHPHPPSSPVPSPT